ncbi:MAG TPA: thioesterase family protein [Stellaceae bacterium]|nr:thioesterase family protein [Stellaceae bacterium]
MSGWVETYKGAVLASEYDAEAYMNSPIYVARFDQATWFLMHSIGVTPAGIKRKKQRVAIVRENYQFLRELKGGELVTVRSGVVAVGKKYLRFVHQMLDGVSGKLVATCDCTAVIASVSAGKSMPLPRPIAKRASAQLLATRE